LSEERKYRHYTAKDIEKYHRGLLSPKEMNELEKAALDDPFLADALEGYADVAINAEADLSELDKKLQQRIAGAKVVQMGKAGRSSRWWKIAAAVIIITGLGFFTLRLSTNRKNKEVAKVEEKKSSGKQLDAAARLSDSNKSTNTEVTSNVKSQETTEEKKVAASSQKYKPQTILHTTTDTSASDLVAADVSAPLPSAPLNLKTEKFDTTRNAGVVSSSRDDFGKRKMAAPQSRQAEGSSVMQEVEVSGYGIKRKERVMKDEEKVNLFRGRVVDANNNPLPFANITNARDNVGTYTDVRGNFTLTSPDSTLEVQVRSVGFENNLARLKNNVGANQIILQEDKTLPEKMISYKKTDSIRSHTANMTLEEPEPVDGWSNYDVYLANNISMSDDFKKKAAMGGQVRLSFEVNQYGNPTNIRVEKSLCKECDEEAIRLVKEGPKWKKKNKKTKRVTISVPFDGLH
jgi:TonB family protein